MNAGDGEVHTASSIPGLFLMTDSFETGGSERQFAELAASVNRVNFRVQLGCIQRRGRFLEGFGHVPEFSLGSSLYSPKSFWTRFRLAQYLRRNKIAVAHAFDFYTNLTLILAAKLAGVPVVIGSQRQLGDLLSHSKEIAQAAMLRSCDAVVCNSHAAANRLIEHGLRKSRVVVIHNGLSAAAFAKTQPALPRRDGVLRVGMIARMNTRSKNHLAFLRAAARLRGSFQTGRRDRRPGLPFPGLQNRRKSGRPGRHVFIGYLHHHRIPRRNPVHERALRPVARRFARRPPDPGQPFQ